MLTDPMTDEAREAAIKFEGHLMTAAMLLACEHGNEYFMYRGQADHHKNRMYALIRGRSAAQVAKLEEARGLAA